MIKTILEIVVALSLITVTVGSIPSSFDYDCAGCLGTGNYYCESGYGYTNDCYSTAS